MEWLIEFELQLSVCRSFCCRLVSPIRVDLQSYYQPLISYSAICGEGSIPHQSQVMSLVGDFSFILSRNL